jgi:hypothetical protein
MWHSAASQPNISAIETRLSERKDRQLKSDMMFHVAGHFCFFEEM